MRTRALESRKFGAKEAESRWLSLASPYADCQLLTASRRTEFMTQKSETPVAERPDKFESTQTRANAPVPPEPAKPITIMLPDDVLKRLKVVAIVRETSVSELVADAAAGVVRKELKKALSMISGE